MGFFNKEERDTPVDHENKEENKTTHDSQEPISASEQNNPDLTSSTEVKDGSQDSSQDQLPDEPENLELPPDISPDLTESEKLLSEDGNCEPADGSEPEDISRDDENAPLGTDTKEDIDTPLDIPDQDAENRLAEVVAARILAEVGEPVRDLSTLISARMRRDDQLLSMQKELERHRADLTLKSLRPFINALIVAHDNLTRRRDSFEAAESEDIPKKKVLNTLDGFLEDIELTMSENGIDRFSEDNVGTRFNSKTQKVVGYVEANEPDLHAMVEKIVRAGFSADEQILQKQRVKVYKYTPPLIEPNHTEIESEK